MTLHSIVNIKTIFEVGKEINSSSPKTTIISTIRAHYSNGDNKIVKQQQPAIQPKLNYTFHIMHGVGEKLRVNIHLQMLSCFTGLR